ncbi:glycoside hydrolase family 92 protein [Neobacillus notoginsengisoli]|uniref:Glycoside hydrolase family 92 protein n=1 Tax=Neobacillus notoginsengisoli TaxID=1578198 RepID=A0A417YZ00_9BACI|nr:GH92 family glycosyl hydrolase [Neobacillus notoginsengisoli]RHW42855.1 glycoside hydrolase family 92 protein [Neobacillus notoginsengisoli]
MKRLSSLLCTVLLLSMFPASPIPASETKAAAATSSFMTSFEKNDPQPTWQNTSETDQNGNKKTSGVIGEIPYDTIQGDITDKVIKVTASVNNPPNEVESMLIDQNPQTKWLAFQTTAWLQFSFAESENIVKYALTSANDAPGRDPQDWTLSGSNDGVNWVELDKRSGQKFASRFERKLYEFENKDKYLHYRVTITKNNGDGLTQLAEVALSNGIDVPAPPPSDMKAFVGDGPTSSYTGKTRAGWTGTQSLIYEGRHEAKGEGYAYNKLYDVDIKVTPDMQLSYFIHPQFMDKNELDYSSTYVSIDLAFTDGTYLSELKAYDQHDVLVNPKAQGESKTLYANQWNYKEANIGQAAEGKTIDRILVAYHNPNGPGVFKGSIDDIHIIANPVKQTYASPVDYVNILRGTNSNGTFSRGNNFPAVAVPHGFNFWTPMTNAGSTSWLYSYQQSNNADNLPVLQAFSLSHETSPWMGDRQTFQVMPSAQAKPSANRSARALPFKHENEIAKPHYYGVTFENGIQTEMTPTNRAAMFKFTFTGNASSLIFDNVNNSGGLTIDVANNAISGYSDVKSGLSTGATRMFVYATFDKPIAASERLTGEGRNNVTGYVQFDTSGADKTVTMKMATSLLSVEQAKKNLEQDIKASDTFDSIKERAKQLWNEKLGIIEVEGANEDQLVTLYSNLYRLFLYPNIAYENTGTEENPVYKYASPFSPATGQNTATVTGAKIVEGKPYVNNGFWDTYRTTWPAYALLTPTQAGEMIDGFVQQYRDGGWVSRWSSPGYANLMVGTSSDVAFADAYLKGIKNFDVDAFYESALKNAAVYSRDQSVGRKGLSTSIFNGYTSTSTGEGLSWALDGYINDFGIANIAKALLEKTDKNDPKYEQYKTDYEYYIARSQNYVEMFNKEVEFFAGRNPDGTWRYAAKDFDPRNWGQDFTETNAWNMAFHVPHDGQGLANLYGGRDQLAKKLDEFFSTPETALHPGGYGGIIHEMKEARDVRMGMYGHSNQPSHHIPYMYNYVGQPWKTQEKVSEILSRLYIGSEIGQGYAGDEDNGEMSAWYILSAAGFYPLQMGLPEYAIGAPFFKKMTIHLENGKDLVIKAPKVSKQNKYVQSLKVNGKAYNKTTIAHELLAEGAVLEFEMGSKPSKWGTGEEALPTSITDHSTDGSSLLPDPLKDLAITGSGKSSHSDQGVASLLFDNDSTTKLTLAGAQPWVQYKFDNGPKRAVMYTITSGDNQAQDPKSWELIGSNDGKEWTVLDKRSDVSFKWRTFTKPFAIQNPGDYVFYRLRVTGNGGDASTTFAEIELLGYDKIAGQFAEVRKQYEKYLASGDVKGALATQFNAKFTQAEDHFAKEDFTQSAKKLEDLLKFINSNPENSSLEARKVLAAEVSALRYSVARLINGNLGKGQWKNKDEVNQVPIFEVSGLSAPAVEPGGDAVVSAHVENIGLLAGDKTIDFYYEGSLKESKSVTLEAGERTTVSFTVPNVPLGLHPIKINELTGVVKALHPGPVLSLSFDESSGTVATDATPYGHNGALKGNASFAAGKFGNALRLNGGYVEIPTSALLNGDDEFTIGLWVNLANPSADQKLIGKTTIGNGFVLGVQGGLYPEAWDTSGSRFSFNRGAISANQWTHLVLTWKQNGKLAGYINGEEVVNIPAGPNPLAPNNNPLIIGGAPWGPSGLQVNGLVDEVKIYKQALTPEQIKQLYTTNKIN